jgi:hypothetical protein
MSFPETVRHAMVIATWIAVDANICKVRLLLKLRELS